MFTKPVYVHPINMKQVYADTCTIRNPWMALAPMPNTIGPFHSKEELKEWIESRKLDLVELIIDSIGAPVFDSTGTPITKPSVIPVA